MVSKINIPEAILEWMRLGSRVVELTAVIGLVDWSYTSVEVYIM